MLKFTVLTGQVYVAKLFEGTDANSVTSALSTLGFANVEVNQTGNIQFISATWPLANTSVALPESVYHLETWQKQ